MAKSLLKLKNYELHAIGSSFEGRFNCNIATWLMQTSMDSKTIAVALFKSDLTIEWVKSSNRLSVNFLSQPQSRVINVLGRKSGRDTDKLKKIGFGISPGGCPFLLESIGYLDCEVSHWAEAGDHEIAICKVQKVVVLNPEKEPLRLNYLREKGLVRG